MNRLALCEPSVRLLEDHLRRAKPFEDGAFFLLREGRGIRGRRLLGCELLLPPSDAWEKQGEGILRPSAPWLSAAVSAAVSADAGLLFVHSHPDAHHPAGFSGVDLGALDALGQTIAPMLDGPFAAAVVHEDSWAGAVWDNSELQPIDRIASVGRGLRILSRSEAADPGDPLDTRQRDALGIVHDRLRTLTIGVVGCGGLGSPIAEQLDRMGVAEIVLIDHDFLDTESNVRRVIGSTIADLNATTPPAKVDVVGRHLDTLGFTTRITRVNGDVRAEEPFRALLDTDVVLAGTDTHGSRATLNELASTYLMPVIDVGVRAGAKANHQLSGLTAELRLLTPTRPCLWCRNAISADVIRAENLPAVQREQLEREGYVVHGVGVPVPSVIALTFLGAAMATCGLISLLSDDGAVAPNGYVIDGMFGDAFETAKHEPNPDCRCQVNRARGDNAAPPFV